MINKTRLILLGLVLLLLALPAAAEEQTVSFGKVTVQADTDYVDLGKVSVTANSYKKFYEFLDKLPELKRVDMYSTLIPRQRIEELKERYPDVEFGWTMKVGNHGVRTDAVSFSTAHSDRSSRHKTEEFSVLKYCKNLVALDIGHNAVKDLSFLYDLPQLKILILVDNQFQDVTPVGSLTELEYLELFYNDIRDVSPLTGLTKLKDLNLGFNRIADISPIEAMTWLERLWVPQFNSHNASKKPDPEMVEHLKAALPDTLVDSTAKSSVGNGWRDHPRYEIMRKIFSDNVWIPLDGEETQEP